MRRTEVRKEIMADKSYELQGERIFECATEGALLRDERDAVELIRAASGHRAGMIVIPAERLDGSIFRLKTGIAGAMLQKFVTYQFRVAILGDISEHLKESSALKDFVRECNRGSQFWFLANRDQLEQRLNSSAKTA
jgi:hypothetical protein